ncbi:Regulatory protein alcR [Penicillium argentinense]|uniref:Regulatory protein alcR n=1 Tax=Penicillium argentinense TaxID=1131581 RepID=A0A9W9FDR8_9EURO|nr:Regulatory protein alcR [Penicillium argentinense]KAJ5098361.1 Regulatory protein alcR [Penicillium argentinense]
MARSPGMDDTRRRQLHSCDPCRKGKRRCDAPKNRKDTGFLLCSNCKRWNKECTFNWLSSKRDDSTGARRRAKAKRQENSQVDELASSMISHVPAPNEVSLAPQWHPAISDDILASSHAANTASGFSFPSHPEVFIGGSEGTGSSVDQFDFLSWSMDNPIDWQISATSQESEKVFRRLESQAVFHNTNYFHSPPETTEQSENEFTPFSHKPKASGLNHLGLNYPSTPTSVQRSSPNSTSNFCIASENAANQYARSTMTRNLIRIYHDSMENALSCWLTEHNCPYSDSTISSMIPLRERKEWGPNWSNRMCIRVCQLDRAASSIRGRVLSVEEDRTAARVLHLAIIAFASQWTQHAQKGTGLSVPEPISRDERSIREYVWNEARHGLERSTRIPSFRIIFANIIFSLTQSPLDNNQDKGLGQLLENDGAPIFLETANRQLFTFRHKYVRLIRESPPKLKESRRGSIGSEFTPESDTLNTSASSAADPIIASQEHRSTLSLLFWLGVMFDTLSAAMYQRPLVVSDEDSQIASASPEVPDSEDQLQFSIEKTPCRKQDVWGEFFLHPAPHQDLSRVQLRWPCSYEKAASVLSEATPVKVLLYRRVTQLQTLVYRGASRERLEEVIQKTLLVYQHWNYTYQRFMLDCVENHELLPSRIQSWYVILDGHWHLATMLLADTLEGIDKGSLGSESEREARKATEFVSMLRIEHAFAVGSLARASLHGQNPSMYQNFHDSLNEVAFLVEPWTVVLIHSFAKAAYISYERMDMSDEHSMLADSFRQNCEFCICALQYLGRKSDMAFMIARNLSRSLSMKLTRML